MSTIVLIHYSAIAPILPERIAMDNYCYKFSIRTELFPALTIVSERD